jgi:SWI/SNF-related matrix-associated actin-dependent regulator 1 of chromatin subfamily A
LLADEPGLGKTIQVLAWLKLYPRRKSIIVVPASLKWNWGDEIDKWTPEKKYIILSGLTPQRISFKYDIVILNYDILHAWVKALKRWGPSVIIADEAHYLKNSKAKRTKAFIKVRAICKYFIALTGTPIVNAPVEFFRVINMVQPGRFPSFWYFVQRYCGAKHNGFGWDFRGSSNEEELYDILTKEGIMLRRLKKDVKKDLPSVSRAVIYLSGDKTQDIDIDTNTIGLAEVESAKQSCIDLKMPYAKEWISDFLESGEKLVVFVHHRKTTKYLKKYFPFAKVIDGSVTGSKRQEIVRTFQNDPSCKLLIGNIKAAGVGLTLTAASNCLFLELPWTPAELKQATDRLCRIGQTVPVTVWFLLVKDSIETKIMKMLDGKNKILSKVLDGTVLSKADLLESMKEE